jgi:nucleoside-diphosphate-sugar epimerase
MKLLITGATGFVGSNVVETALQNNHEVIGLTRSGKLENLTHLSGKNLILENVDLNNYGSVVEVIKKHSPDVILHVAAVHPPKPLDSPYECFDSNVKGTVNLLEAARNNNIKKFVYMSSMSVYGNAQKLPVDENHPINPTTFYGCSKLAAELYCKLYSDTYGFKMVILRCSGIYGHHRKWGAVTNFVKNVINNIPPKVNSDISWDIVYVKDIADAFMSAAQQIDNMKFEIINIGSGTEVNIKDLVKMIISLDNSKIEPEFNITSLNSFRFYFNIEKAKRLLNFQPTPLEKGLSEYIAWEKMMNESPSS